MKLKAFRLLNLWEITTSELYCHLSLVPFHSCLSSHLHYIESTACWKHTFYETSDIPHACHSLFIPVCYLHTMIKETKRLYLSGIEANENESPYEK